MSKSKKTTAWVILGITGIGILALAAFLLALSRNYEVLEKGNLLNYTNGVIYKIRFFDTFTVLVEPERRPAKDVFNSYLLTGISFISLTYAFLIAFTKKYGVTSRVFWMYAIMVVGTSYLAVDEFFGVHESIGHNMQFLASLPLVSHPDDVIIMSYIIPMALFLYIFRKEFLAARPSLIAVAGVVAFVVLASLADLLTLPLIVEELSEIIASGLLVISVLLLGWSHLHKAVEQGEIKTGA